MINWDSEPDATAFKPDCDDWYASWWKFVGGAAYCKYSNPEHWQPVGWIETTYNEHLIKSLKDTVMKDQEVEAKVSGSIVTAYKTTDGKVFTELADAEEHQTKLDVWNNILDTLGVYGEVKLSYFEDFLDMIKFYEESKK